MVYRGGRVPPVALPNVPIDRDEFFKAGADTWQGLRGERRW
jgi:hypothetical protein